MAMRRGKIFETMRSEEAGRVYGLLERFGKQEVAMEGMAEERRRLAELREEKRRLKQSDIQDNVQRSMRAMQYRNEDLKAKFAMEDERELARRAGKAQLVEDNMKASLASTFERQELMDKLAKARGREALLSLSQEVSNASPSSMRAGEGDAAAPPPSRPESARLVPQPPAEPNGQGRAPRPTSARAR